MLWLAFALLQDPVVGAYVEKVCSKLAPGVACSVSVEALARAAVSDGVVSVSTGMIAGSQNEAELAGILAHEIAHVKSGGVCLRFAPGPESEKVQGAVQRARAAEHEADQAGIGILLKAGYDAGAMLRYFSRIRHAEPDLPVAFSAEDVLIERLQLEATDRPVKDPLVDTDEFRAVRARMSK
jgi:predicted Zn-dependent protease